jgi:6-pyruvoyltetrahydropterin/6-carboxytetrahydropterin synthase
MSYHACVQVRFAAGHRLMHHGGKCQYPHGHSYRAEIFLGADDLPQEDWIVDFGEVKMIAREVLDEHLDHAFILDSRDVELLQALRAVEPTKIYVLENRAPTAERIAEELYRLLSPRIHSLRAVRVWESAQQYGEYAHVGSQPA